MPKLSRTQYFLCALIGVSVVLIGVGAFGGGGSAGPVPASGDNGADSSPSTAQSTSRSKGKVVVHVAGEVRRAGVIGLEYGARVVDAIGKAGGATGRADLAFINLAAPLMDGQQIIVPARASATGGPGSGPAAGDGSGVGGSRISLATASAAELETLDGIGPATAAKIVAFRTERGGIASVEDLEQIHGIGPATIELLRSQLAG